ncbi:MAG: choice-of-anchor L domain-containing protein [Lewinellaceae bacterium]|nr:choice-of-anchor L domain-containing protein [Saprospiraceae bacterium]MCB9311704.1 choice-of-anchor L domain-containing protein [Lewinellaceae bacterium]HRW75127.1 choice-of-anchor L domain-containing protein [Saprospiraceae bacterium]
MRFFIFSLLCLTFVPALFSQPETRQESPVPYVSPYTRGGSNLILDTAYSVQELISDFFSNSCVEPFNITMKGSQPGMGFFQATGTELGVPAGIMLSTGNIWTAIGPNNQGGAGNSFGKSGDPDLDLLLGQVTFDALAIEFDFIPSVSDLTFRYVFSSEEYPEYVCALFNDVFGFFLSGPGLSGPYSGDAINIATLPDTTIYVGINSVNPGVSGAFGNLVNCGNGSLDYGWLYFDNTGGQQLQADGFTVPLDANVLVIPGEVYHAKIVVADAGDAIFDSSVFLSVESLCGDSLLNPVAVINKLEYTGPKSISMEGRLKYGYNDWTWDFGDNQLKEKNKTKVSHTYLNPGLYTVKMYGSNFCCSDTAYQVVPIQVPPYIANTVVKPVSCAGMANGQIMVDALSSSGDLTYLWSDGNNQQNRSDLSPGAYSVTITDTNGQSTTAGPFVVEEPERVSIALLQSEPGEEGERNVFVLAGGGNGGYTYQWMDGFTFSQRNDLIQGMDYTVTVTDKKGCSSVYSFTFGTGQSETPVSQIRLFPNPSSSELRIAWEDQSDCTPGVIRVFSALGELRFEEAITCGREIVLSVSQWPDGVYVMQFTGQTGPIARTFFVRH